MPVGYGDGYWWGNGSSFYSFILRSPEDEDAFLAENREALEAMGLQVSILENGWKNFKLSASTIKQSTAMSAGVFALVLPLALALAAFLYLRQRRRDFAILRSLGVPKSAAIRQMLQPVVLIGVIGVLAGGLMAWRYALAKATTILAVLQGPRVVETSAALSLAWLAGLCTGAFALLLFFNAVGALTTARRPVLELLQGAGQAADRRRPKVQGSEGQVSEAQPTVTKAAFSLGEAPAPAGNPGFTQVSRYILRHIRRAPLKSIMTVAVALCFT